MGVLELIRGKRGDSVNGLAASIIDVLNKREWFFNRNPDTNVIYTGVNGNNADFQAAFVINDERSTIWFYVEYSPKVPEERRREAADFMTRANYGLWIGNFELNMENGEVRYKVSIDVENGKLSKEMVDNMIWAGFSTADKYFPAFMSVCFGNEIPSVAIRSVE